MSCIFFKYIEKTSGKLLKWGKLQQSREMLLVGRDFESQVSLCERSLIRRMPNLWFATIVYNIRPAKESWSSPGPVYLVQDLGHFGELCRLCTIILNPVHDCNLRVKAGQAGKSRPIYYQNEKQVHLKAACFAFPLNFLSSVLIEQLRF